MDELTALVKNLIQEEVRRQIDSLREDLKHVEPELPRVMTTAQVAAVFGRHPTTVSKACASGELVARQRGKGGHWMIRPEDVEQWLGSSPRGSVKRSRRSS